MASRKRTADERWTAHLGGPAHPGGRTGDGLLWISKSNDRYPKFRVGDRQQRAHVHAWEREHGPVPDGHVVHHECEVKWCVSLDCLRLLTNEAHTALHAAGNGRRELKARCVNGHEFTPENTKRLPSDPHRRICLTCRREKDRRRRERIAGAR